MSNFTYKNQAFKVEQTPGSGTISVEVSTTGKVLLGGSGAEVNIGTSVVFSNVTAVTVSAPVTSGGHLKVRDSAGNLWYIPVFATTGL